ncbi:hypothetical protein [Arthrobacter sp. B1I2]|uniref:hypothetical protein n=1 Tax=Arthrobacter sp. B1I2 TaxID=3042263 RepID=UPI002784BDF5|nr:hypothetical protein [Arthrobacter sp. B1I2]MDQ0732512.1 hypothetical protein [Arthrobacter sp. B1I2]
MERRKVLLLGLAAAAALLVSTLVVGSMAGENRACPAMGWAFVGDVELSFSTPPESVSACFGEGCTPQPLTKNAEGKWLVPQSPPYLTPPVSITSIYVDARTSSGKRLTRALAIEAESTGEYPFGRECGGPFRFKPVQVVPA